MVSLITVNNSHLSHNFFLGLQNPILNSELNIKYSELNISKGDLYIFCNHLSFNNTIILQGNWLEMLSYNEDSLAVEKWAAILYRQY